MTIRKPPDFLDEVARREWFWVARLLVNRRRWDPRQASTLTSYAEAYSAWARLTPRIRGKEMVREKRRDGSTRVVVNPLLAEHHAEHDRMQAAVVEVNSGRMRMTVRRLTARH